MLDDPRRHAGPTGDLATVAHRPNPAGFPPALPSTIGLPPPGLWRLEDPGDPLARLCERVERVPLRSGQVLHERHCTVAFAYFLVSGLASVTARAERDSRGVEIVCLAGGDMAGHCLVLGNRLSPYRCAMLTSGEAWRIEADVLTAALADDADLRRLLLRHVHVLMSRTAQMGLCNGSHTVRQRLARWLLFACEGARGGEIAVTHALLARALGVRRAGVTAAMGRFEAEGVIGGGRGRVGITDRSALEREACDCQRIVAADRRRLLCEPCESW